MPRLPGTSDAFGKTGRGRQVEEPEQKPEGRSGARHDEGGRSGRDRDERSGSEVWRGGRDDHDDGAQYRTSVRKPYDRDDCDGDQKPDRDGHKSGRERAEKDHRDRDHRERDRDCRDDHRDRDGGAPWRDMDDCARDGRDRGHHGPRGDDHDCGCHGGRVQPGLEGFSSVLHLMERAARSDMLDVMFDQIVGRVGWVAERLNARAEQRGYCDTDDTPIGVVFGGDASAYGTDTMTRLEMQGTVVDLGHVSYAVGFLALDAVAVTTDGSLALALADGFADIAGADLVVTFTSRVESELSHDATTAFASTRISFIAIDLEYWEGRNGPIILDYDAGGCNDVDLAVMLEGNFADVTANLDSHGENTYAELQTDLLTIEDVLSSSTAMGTLAIG